ncbi:MAG: hypothetical protein SPJ13_06925 [Bacteroidales bacterium]|nr:hypothetical protein [Bacteroidales bacterium]
MKKETAYLVVLVALLVGAGSLQAQRRQQGAAIWAYPVAGVVTSQVQGDMLKGFEHWGFTAGVGAIVPLDGRNRWSMSVEADFTQRGMSEKSYSLSIPYQVDLTLNYVDIPLLLHFRDPYGGMTFGLGVCYGRLVQQPHGTLRYNPLYIEPDTSDMTFLKNDLSAVASFRFTLWENLKLEFRGQYSFIDVKKDWRFVEHLDGTGGQVKEYLNDCQNFSLSMRVMWIFGEQQQGKARHTRKYRK